MVMDGPIARSVFGRVVIIRAELAGPFLEVKIVHFHMKQYDSCGLFAFLLPF